MGYCYKVETLELALVADGTYLMNIGEDTDERKAFPTKVKATRLAVLVMPLHFRGNYNKAKYFNRNQLVTIFTPVSEISESEKIDLEWALMNGNYHVQ